MPDIDEYYHLYNGPLSIIEQYILRYLPLPNSLMSLNSIIYSVAIKQVPKFLKIYKIIDPLTDTNNGFLIEILSRNKTVLWVLYKEPQKLFYSSTLQSDKELMYIDIMTLLKNNSVDVVEVSNYQFFVQEIRTRKNATDIIQRLVVFDDTFNQHKLSSVL